MQCNAMQCNYRGFVGSECLLNTCIQACISRFANDRKLYETAFDKWLSPARENMRKTVFESIEVDYNRKRRRLNQYGSV